MAAKFQTAIILLVILAVNTTHGQPSHDHKRNDDVSVASLQTLVQQQASLIQHLQADLTTTKSRLSALESSDRSHGSAIGAIQTKLSKNVAFTVRFSHDNSSVGLPMTAGSTLHFDRVVYNVGSGYDTRSGIFTAPVSGTYVFYLTTMSVNGHRAVYLRIMKEGNTLDQVYAEGHSDANDQGSGEVTCHLNQGQQVWIVENNGDAVRGGWYTVFTGFLIHAD